MYDTSEHRRVIFDGSKEEKHSYQHHTRTDYDLLIETR